GHFSTFSGGEFDNTCRLLVDREGTSLVRGNRGAAPEALNGSKLSHDDVPLCHPASGDRKGNRNGNRQPLRNCGNDKGNRKEENINWRSSLVESNSCYHNTCNNDQDADVPREVLHPDQEG